MKPPIPYSKTVNRFPASHKERHNSLTYFPEEPASAPSVIMLSHQNVLLRSVSATEIVNTRTAIVQDDSDLDSEQSLCRTITPPPIIEDSKPLLLPTMPGQQHPDLNYITCDTLRSLIDGEFSCITKYIVVDCRFPYEFAGGHVNSPHTINLHTKQQVDDFFFLKPICEIKNLVIIFHCEFSSKRGPSLYRYLRSNDRKIHQHNYPELYYTDLYVLEGGYKKFFEQHKEYCFPAAYVEMLDKNYSTECKQEVADMRRSWKKSKSFSGFCNFSDKSEPQYNILD